MLPISEAGIYGKLYDEYKLYQLDSALVYLGEFSNSRELDDTRKITEARLALAIMGTLRMYKEATDLLIKSTSTDLPT
jgi:hypothetical protein